MVHWLKVITSYTYENNRRRRQADNKNIYQEDTGRVRPTTDGNGGNNVVCSVNDAGVPDTASRNYARKDNLQALAKIDPYDTDYLKSGADCSKHYAETKAGGMFGGQRACGPNLYCRLTNSRTGSAICSARNENADARNKRTFFADLNGNGIVDYPQCRRRRTVAGSKSPCGEDGNEFPLRDLYSSTTANPAGGANTEFVDKDGKVCDALNMNKDCKPAMADWRRGGSLIDYLSTFCDTPAALYQVPVHEDGKVPDEFGAVTYPMPICGYKNLTCTNYRAKARADFGSHGKGTYLQCQTKTCREGTKPSAAQGIFNTNVDKYVSSKSPSDAYVRPWYPMIGGTNDGTKPAGVPAKWTMKGSASSGLFNQDVLKNHWTSANEGAKYAKSRVELDGKRLDGVTCLNGKFIYAREMPHENGKAGPRPIVSTVREAFNRNGPLGNGQFACRYLGVHCNANNCNNNGNGEVPGPFVEPKMKPKAKSTEL